MKVTLLLLLGLAGIWADPEDNPENRWVNNYDEPLHFECPNHQSISLIISNHDNKREDRVWDFSCKATFSEQRFCYWTGYVNDFDQEFTFTCASGSVLTGMDSIMITRGRTEGGSFSVARGRCQLIACARGVDMSINSMSI
ncbi:hypothetical protein XENTR_v10018002 [Xenopus tropicalis]|nr:hypothetical protein XENTR_v10018002 [Xenopus tropicalis]|eukprot:XP_017951432.1 PREDICTED: hemagglutinin/amebocyte aggregation factor-like [Xenopus tropicalis]